MRKNLSLLAFAASALVAAGSANAYITYSGIDANGNEGAQVAPTNSGAAETSFKSNLVGVGTQDFESYAVGTAVPAINPISFGVAGNATLLGSGSVRGNAPDATNGFGRYSVPGGQRYWETDAGSGNFEITFSNQIAAFGFYGIDLGDFEGTLSLELFDGGNLVGTQNVTTLTSNTGAQGSILYLGLIAGSAAEEFNRVRFVSTRGSGDFFAFDSFTIGTREQVQIPEPASLALVAVALLGLGLSSRRRT